ncbi:SGNH/GDSL hydrolase family protein [Mumia sp. DW29H23]|uniref:SGNH/GDSL hydrolase family protein n=1 Tax=Mumia sp. DW29H23 TaxID=3421241 RepID=UPI003D6988F9
MTTYRRFVALGDSVTEGIGDDLHPDGTPQGWADRLAVRLAAASPDLRYANLAVRGKLTRAIRLEQLDAARALEPDLVGVVAGMNDLIRPRFDVGAVTDDVEHMVSTLRGEGAAVLMMTFPDLSAVSPVGRLLRTRVLALNSALRAVAARQEAVILDVREAPSSGDPRLWADDRLHLNAAGHTMLAEAMGSVLGVPSDGAWRDPLPPPAPRNLRVRVQTEATWLRGHLGPWIGRRVTGRSSGDGRTAKAPALRPVV